MKRRFSQRVTVAFAALLIAFGGFGAALAQSQLAQTPQAAETVSIVRPAGPRR